MAKLMVSDFDKAIGKRIQMRRKEAGLSAEKLSEKIGISQQQLSRYERGDNKINITHLIYIAQILRTPLNWFFMDCYPETAVNVDDLKQRLDFHWQNLDDEQKRGLIRFLDLMR